MATTPTNVAISRGLSTLRRMINSGADSAKAQANGSAGITDSPEAPGLPVDLNQPRSFPGRVRFSAGRCHKHSWGTLAAAHVSIVAAACAPSTTFGTSKSSRVMRADSHARLVSLSQSRLKNLSAAALEVHK